LRDLRVSKVKARAACRKLKKIWKSYLRRTLKICLFVATVEYGSETKRTLKIRLFVPTVEYGSERRTLTESMKNRIDGCYTKMLGMTLNVDWKLHVTNCGTTLACRNLETSGDLWQIFWRHYCASTLGH
jgi:hypothetical protein